MREVTKTYRVYKWEDLSEEQQEKVIENYWDINVDYEWWDHVYDDAENIGLKITEFDLDRGSYVRGDFIGYAMDTATKILADHGEHCETYKTAQDYFVEYKRMIEAQCQAEADLLCIAFAFEEGYAEIHYDLEELITDDIDREFLRSLCEDYRISLQREYEYLTSREAIIEAIVANEYEFGENLKIWGGE